MARKQKPQRRHHNLRRTVFRRRLRGYSRDPAIPLETFLRDIDGVLDLLGRPMHSESALPVHLINVDIKDNHEEAFLGGQAILKLVEMLEAVDEVEVDGLVEDILVEWMKGPGARYPVVHTIAWL